MPNIQMILVVNPHTFTYPRAVTDVEFPRKFHARSRPENNTRTDFRAKEPQDSNAETRTNLPGVGDEQELKDRPEIHHDTRSVPSCPLARSRRQVDNPSVCWQRRIVCIQRAPP